MVKAESASGFSFSLRMIEAWGHKKGEAERNNPSPPVDSKQPS
jgi:hypothetical protein